MKFTVTIWITAILLLVASPGFAQFDGGSGTEGDPYQVATLEQLQEVGNHLGSHFIQTADIDGSETLNWNEGMGFEPIAASDTVFTGSYNGNGFAIQDLTIFREEESPVGLFRKSSGHLKNIVLDNASITGEDNTGGIVGSHAGGIIDSSSVLGGNVSGVNKVGCVAGNNNPGEINNSHGTCDASGEQNVGGLVGEVREGGIIRTSSSTDNNVSSTTHDAGGLVGAVKGGEVYDSYATGFVSAGEKRAGGLAGHSQDETSVISNCYATGMVSTTDVYAGGLLGRNRDGSKVINSYSTGAVYGGDEATAAGFIGGNFDGGEITASYWDTETSGLSVGVKEGESDGVAGLTTVEMTGAAAAENMAGFDFDEVWVTTDDSYPELYWQEQEEPTSIAESETDIPSKVELHQNYPNPFNPTTKIQFGLPNTGYVQLEIYDMLGKRISTIVEGTLKAGVHTVNFDGSNLSSGIYIYRIISGEYVQTKKMVLLK